MEESALAEEVKGSSWYCHYQCVDAAERLAEEACSTTKTPHNRQVSLCAERYKPEVGQLCAAYSSTFETWYLARVDLLRTNHALVTFVDYGIVQEVPLNLLQSVENDRICLSQGSRREPGVASISWCPDASRMRGEQKKKKVHQNANERNRRRLPVQQDEEKHTRVSKKTKRARGAIQDKAISGEEDMQGCQAPAQYQPPPSTQSVARFLHLDMEIKIRVLEVESPSLFWAWRADEDTLKHLPKLIIDMTKHYSQLKPKKGFKPIKALYAGKFAADDRWYRAQLLDFNTSTAQVLFVDFGNKESLPFDCIHSLVSSYGSLPLQAMACGLAGFPADKQWTSEETSRFETQLVAANWLLDARVVSRSFGYVMLDLKNPLTGHHITTEMGGQVEVPDTDGKVTEVGRRLEDVSISGT